VAGFRYRSAGLPCPAPLPLALRYTLPGPLALEARSNLPPGSHRFWRFVTERKLLSPEFWVLFERKPLKQQND